MLERSSGDRARAIVSPRATSITNMGTDRRRAPRGKDRRNLESRVEGVWTEAERQRFITELRDARRDAQAVTIQAGTVVVEPAGEQSHKR